MNHLLNIVNQFKKVRATDNLKLLHRNELDKACSAHDSTYSDIKDLAKITISDQILNR